ncbi:four-carbon acid sugar kinase family protein, partial [bacterium]
MIKNNKILVIADDLTGCGDTAYWAVKQNIECDIYTNKNSLFKTKTLKKINIVNTGTRDSSSKQAYRAVHEICKWAIKHNIHIVFKKMDSTLRGSFAKENDALITAFDSNYLPLCAVYPEYGRTTKNGYHYINNKRIDKTEFANDPKSPVTCSHIPTILKKASKYAQITKVYDAQTSKDMKNIALKVFKKWENQKFQIAAGASRFFGELLKKWHTKKTIPIQKQKKFTNILVTCASRNPVTLDQVSYLLKQHEFKNIKNAKHYSIYKSKNIYVLVSADKFYKNYDLKFISQAVRNLSRMLNKPLLILCGGDTAESVCSAMHFKKIKCVSNLAHGIILGKITDNNIYTILKSGGFGSKSLLADFVK